MTAYTDTIRRYAMDTSRSGALEGADGTGEVGLGREEAGRRLAVRFTLRVLEGRAEQVRFQVFGCGFTIAACAATAELAEGRSLDELETVSPTMIDALLDGLPAERGYCAELAVEALQAAVTSARSDTRAVQSANHDLSGEAHGPRVTSADPVYRLLMESPIPTGIPAEDRHLFACLLSVAVTEPHATHASLGLFPESVKAIMEHYFPGIAPDRLESYAAIGSGPPPAANEGVRTLLLSHLPPDIPDESPSAWLARIIAARAAHPGHLWIAMGLFRRPELSAAIRRLLPALAEANDRGMRWKRYLFRQVCELHGAVLCKAPDCGVCSDYELCFSQEEE